MALDWTALPHAFEVVADSAGVYLTKLIPLSEKLLGVAVLISGAWLLLKESLTNSPRNAIAALMLLIMQAAIALAVITQWPLFAEIVYGLQSDLANAVGGGGNAIVTALEPISRQFGPLWDYFGNQRLVSGGESMNPLVNIYNVFVEFVQTLFTLPLTMLMSAVTVLLLGLIVAVLGGAIMFAEISIVIGLVAAPFLIAMNFFPYVNFTVDGLVRFLLGAVLLKFVAMLTALLLGAALDSIFVLDLPATGSPGARFVAMTYVIVIAAMFLYVAIKVDDIARALMSGGVVGGPGAKVVSAGSLAAGQGAAGGATGAAGGAAKGAIGGAKTGFQSGGIGGSVAGTGGGAYRGAAAGAASGAMRGAGIRKGGK